MCRIIIENTSNWNEMLRSGMLRNIHIVWNEFYNQMHWKCQLAYTIIMFCKHPAAWLVIKNTTSLSSNLYPLKMFRDYFKNEWTFLSSNGNKYKWNTLSSFLLVSVNYKYLHSSQLSLPFRMQRFFLFLIQFSLHVKQNPLVVHVSHPVGHCIHSCRFLSP